MFDNGTPPDMGQRVWMGADVTTSTITWHRPSDGPPDDETTSCRLRCLDEIRRLLGEGFQDGDRWRDVCAVGIEDADRGRTGAATGACRCEPR